MANYTRYILAILFIQFTTTSLQNPASINKINELRKQHGLALEAIFGLGIRLQVLLEDPSTISQSNFLVSPLSVTLLISQLMIGADANFKAELYSLLSLPNNNDHKHDIINYYGNYENTSFTVPYANFHTQLGNLLRKLETNNFLQSFTLNCSNGLFYNQDIKLLHTFAHNLRIYETEIKKLNFSTDPLASQRYINSWAAEHTNGIISNVFPSVLPRTTSAIFTNALYFKADWETPFSFELNMNGPFHISQQKTVEVEYMQRTFDSIPYADSQQMGCRIVQLPYKNNEVAMYFILPHVQGGKEYNIRKFAEKLKSKDLLLLIDQMKNAKVAFQLPKLKLANSLSILDPLQKYRVFEKIYGAQLKRNDQSKDPLEAVEKRIQLYNALSTTEKINIELGEAAENEVLKVSNIIQQVSLSVDEKGTEAAAITASIIDYIGGTKSFRLERPFAFIVRHELTTATLFWGTVSDPSQN